MLQTVFEPPATIQAILARAALEADVFDAPASIYDPTDAVPIGGLTIADIDEAARGVKGLFACGICKFFI